MRVILSFFLLLSLFLLTVARVPARACTLTASNYNVTIPGFLQSAGENLPAHQLTVNCPSGTSYTISIYSPSPTTGGYIYLYKGSQSLYLILYKDPGMTQYLKSSDKVLKTGTGTGQDETVYMYPVVRPSTYCSYRSSISKYVCPVGVYTQTLTFKVTF
jgi:spore coat protein U-like protein